MKKLFILLAITALGLGVRAQDGQKLPNITLKDMNGKDTVISDYGKSGKIVIVNFWATWCKPCVEELTKINDLYDDWKEKYNVELVAVSIDDAKTAQKVRPFVNGKNWDYTVLLDPNGDLKRAMNVMNPPYTFVVNQKGDIVYKHESYVPGAEIELEEKLAELAKAEKGQ